MSIKVKAMNSLVIGHKGNVVFATVNIPNSSNEDRASSLLTHDTVPTGTGPDIMSFAVIDGHNSVGLYGYSMWFSFFDNDLLFFVG